MLEAVKVWPSKAGKGGVRRKVGATPTLTSPARAGFAILRVGASKETDQKERCAALKPLDKKGPIQGVTRGQRMRVDTTVVETDIHHPTDSTLLGDSVRVLTRVMKKITKRVRPASNCATAAGV